MMRTTTVCGYELSDAVHVDDDSVSERSRKDTNQSFGNSWHTIEPIDVRLRSAPLNTSRLSEVVVLAKVPYAWCQH